MVRCTPPPSGESFVDNLLDWWIDWQITFLMIFSMSFQIFLVLAGFLRKHTAHRGLHASIWIAFLGMDAVAAYALGLMLGSGCGNVFSLYAPILLFHLGATDAINAYSPADNELWLRYAFKMALEIVAAADILSRSGDCSRFLPCGTLLFIVGAFKYAERIYALRGGSQAQILASARPTYTFMMSLLSEKIPEVPPRPHPLIVAGEWEWYRQYSEQARLQLVTEDGTRNGHSRSLRLQESIVTYDDIYQCRKLQQVVHSYINDVCLAFALYKIYRRRLTNLRMHQKDYDYDMVRKAIFADTTDRILRVIDLELSFIFDGVFSKGAAGTLYQGIGVVTRLVSLALLFAAAINLIVVDTRQLSCESNTIHWGIGLLHVLVIMMILVECTQIFKLVRSNWIRVWLACTYIKKRRLADGTQITDPALINWKNFYVFQARAICFAFTFVGKPKSTHWNFKMEQLSIAVDCLDSVCLNDIAHTEISSMCDAKERREEIKNLCDVTVQDLLKYLIEMTQESFKQNRKTSSIEGEEFSASIDAGLELAILNWHVATTVCEMRLLQMRDYQSFLEKNKYIKKTIGLSRYCMHLMIRRPNLMPEDRDVAKTLYKRFKDGIKDLCLQHPQQNIVSVLVEDHHSIGKRSDPESASAAESVDHGIRRGRDLIKKFNVPEEMWKTLAGIWMDILIYIAIQENAIPHTEQMGKGGELLTFLWVFLGHLGAAQTLLPPRGD